MAKRSSSAAKEIEELRARAFMILDAFDRAEPSPTWTRFREGVERANRISDLRSINRDLRGAMAGLAADARTALEQELTNRFGPDVDQSRIHALAVEARARGMIRSEHEYRAVQAYADSIAGRSEDDHEFLALAALLDEYTSRSELPNDR